MRFPEKEVMMYRKHLDRHFRENRRQKENRSRGWYTEDWKWDLDSEDSDEGGMIMQFLFRYGTEGHIENVASNILHCCCLATNTPPIK
jgi:hypothetical protein